LKKKYYEKGAENALRDAQENKWLVVSMKKVLNLSISS
jgi:hypothetical protein